MFEKTSKYVLIILFSLSFMLTYGQRNQIMDKPKVDERIEILSIVFRLAGNQEYSSTIFKRYVDRVNQHYGPFKEHELITFVNKIKNENGIGYDAVMSMAIHLDDKFNIKQKNIDETLDKRWSRANALQFATLLKKFYKDSNSKGFFQDNQALYNEVQKRFLPIYEHIELDWYPKFYGKKPSEKFLIVNGLGNGGGNYGVAIKNPQGHKEVYAIMGTWNMDSLGMAQFPLQSYFPTLLHEFNHSFVNYLLEKDTTIFRDSGVKLYSIVKEKMNGQAYGSWQTMLNEALVRAAVIKYQKDHNFSSEEISKETNEQLDRGFLWIEKLVDELENFDRQRNRYPSLESYMPVLAKAYQSYATDISSLDKTFEEKRPKIISFEGIQDGQMNVSSTLGELKINFDKPLLGQGRSFRGISKESFPVIKGQRYSPDKKSVIIDWELEPNKTYEIIMTGKAFRTADGIPMKDHYLKFSTK
ncbi:DUF4932 domain-containing protein [Sphingobacterium sp. 40-24]|uniref:DUF4932 domain-containing protein n=1 Tax=Sphingobacterium sp. 40-24 TaxID=1895843 RepID=UPI00096607E8|nr:DUF4932 domain-containing protein [Sphingobacterium sp. 40-24]OJZ00429.1 MAG: hypothetical protein BGP15_23995 [Sphingobacterium sp. 40-24]